MAAGGAKDTGARVQEAASAQPQTVVLQERNVEAERAAVMVQAKELEMDTTIPGGRYLVAGRLVDANGVAIEDAKSASGSEEGGE